MLTTRVASPSASSASAASTQIETSEPVPIRITSMSAPFDDSRSV